MRLRSKITGAAVGTASVVFFAAAPSASAHVAGSPPQLQVIKTVSSAYVGPLQFAVDGKVIYVADSFTSTLNRLERDGHNTVIATGPDPSTGGDIRRRRRRPVPPRACVHQQHRRPLAHHPDDPAAGRQADHRQPVQIRSERATPINGSRTESPSRSTRRRQSVSPTRWPWIRRRPHRVRSKATSVTAASSTRTHTP